MPPPEALHSAIGRVVRVLSVDLGSPLSLETIAVSIAEALSGGSAALKVAYPDVAQSDFTHDHHHLTSACAASKDDRAAAADSCRR